MKRTLLIGYGNTLRSDDGVGVRAAEALARSLPDAHLELRHELQLELAATIAQFDDVFFLDASGTGEREVRATPLVPEQHAWNTGSHTCSPGTLLALCASLYGRVPGRATLVTIPAENFAFGEELSMLSREKLTECIELVQAMAGNL